MAENMQLKEDLLIEILSRLPVKSLIRSICVCKYWHSLIKSPEFATKHYSTRLNLLQTQNQSNEDAHDSLLSSFSPSCSISIFSYHNLSYKTAFEFRPCDSSATDLTPRFGVSHSEIINDFAIHGPCNGLFLITLLKGFNCDSLVLLIWNPATREVFKIPKSDEIRLSNGLGFDTKSNDYKVVSFNGNDDANTSVAMVYSLKGNDWRRVDDAGVRFGENGECLCWGNCTTNNGGICHWIGCDVDNSNSNCLLSFNMVDELFTVTPMPDEMGWPAVNLMNKGSHLMYPIVYDHSYNTTAGITIWGLNGYGSDGVWSKKRVIQVPEMVITGNQLMTWKDDGVVFIHYLDDHSEIAWYNLETKQVEPLRIYAEVGHVVGYTESLVSVHHFLQPASIDDDDDDDDDDDGDDDGFDEDALGRMHEDAASYFRKRREWRRLSKLPYCLREVNILCSNPCTF